MLAGVLAGVFGLNAAVAAEGASAPETVVMSPFEVSANSVDFISWRKVSTTNFIIYSDAGAKRVDQLLRQMEMLHTMAQRYFRRKAVQRRPMIFVLPTSGSDWRKIESKSNVQWRVAISDPAHTLGDVIITHYDWEDDPTLIFDEFGRAELRWLNLPEPLWFQRGMMEFVGAARFEGERVSLGEQGWKVPYVVRGGWLDWPAMFRVTFQSPEYVRADLVHRLDGQAGVFVQYLLTHTDPSNVERLMQWVSITDAKPNVPEAEFERIFGKKYGEWEKMLDGFLRGGQFRVSQLTLPRGALEIKTTNHTLPVREMRELFVVAQIMNQRVPAAQESLDKLLARGGLKTEALRELLAEACVVHDRPGPATAELRKLIDAGSTNPEVFALAASLGFRARVPEVGLQSRITEGGDELRAWCARAIELEPRHREANRIDAWLQALGPTVDTANIEAIKQAYQRVAGNSSTVGMVAALAVAVWRTGDGATARGLCQKLVESSFTDQEALGVATALLRETASAP